MILAGRLGSPRGWADWLARSAATQVRSAAMPACSCWLAAARTMAGWCG